MKTNVTKFHDASELQQVLQSHLIVNKTTVEDTQEFLSQYRLRCSEEIKQGDKYFNTLIKTSDNPSNIRFDSCIGCKIPISSNRARTSTWNSIIWLQALLPSFLMKWECLVRFYFYEGILTEINIRTVGTGF
ncbi:MAG: hypothetical protein H0X30_11670 [Anaerolineae bacterium]|nr:hypothetical protein [Anaerolineae bacterium]